MKTWNRFLQATRAIHISISVLTMLCVAALFTANATAQRITSTLLASQGFTSSAFPSGWTDSGPWSTYVNDNYSWMWSSTGNGGSNGAAMDDIWDYSAYNIATPPINTSSFANAADSVWVDFDLFWEYNGYDAEIGDQDEFEIDGTSGDQLVSGTVASMYTYYNTDDFNYDVAQSSSEYWVHYHLLIPISDRTSAMVVKFLSVPDYSLGLSDAVIDNVTITASFVPPPELALTPKALNFGTAAAGVGDTLYATVNSVGLAPLTITNTSVTGASAYSVVSGPENGTVIPVGSSVQYGIQFLPLNSGTLSGTFTLYTTGADSGTQSISLTGIGAVPDVAYSAKTMFRGVSTELTDTSAVQYLYVNSTGQGPLNIKSISFYGLDAQDYFVTHIPTGSIPSGGVDSIGVRFVPNLEGQPDAHMVITSTASNTPIDTVALYGVGILPHLAIDSAKSWPLPTSVNFDSVNLGAQSCLQVLLTNPGSDTVAIEKNYFESADVDFSLTPLTGRDTLIPPGGSKNIQVCFTPVQQGTRVATLRIRTNIPNTETKPPQDTSSFVVNIIGVGVPSAGNLLVTGPAQTDSAIAEPGYSSGCQTDTLWNTTNATITVDSIIITGFNFNYKVNESALTLPPHTHSTFQVCADPTDTGAITALLTAYGVSDGTLLTGTLKLGIYGESIGDEAGIGTPLSSLTCDTESATVIVTNTGNAPNTYTASISGANAADFKITSPSISPTLRLGETFTYTIVFTPSKVGSESANISVTRSADGGITGPFSISGTGGAATIGGQGTAATAAPSAPAEQFFDTLMNTGTCPWTPGVPTLADNVDFTYESGATTPIPAGGTGLLTFLFNPSATVGPYSSNVAFPNSVGLTTAVSNTVYGTVAVSDVAATSSNGFSIEQNYPNPFNQTSQFEITLPVACLVHLSIIDVEGQVVQTLLNQHYDAGSFEVTLDASGLASGTYYYQMTAGTVTLTKQMVILK